MSDKKEYTENTTGDTSDEKREDGMLPKTGQDPEKPVKETEKNKDGAEEKKNAVCMVCHRPESKAGKMIELPGGLYICMDCWQKSIHSMQDSGMDFGSLMQRLPHNISMIDLTKLGGMLSSPISRRKEKKKAESGKEEKEKKSFSMKDVPPPHRIKAQLDEYVIGQEHAKKALAVAVYNHYKRILSEPSQDVEIEKSNILMIGPTGSGKTYLVQTLARLLDVPLAMTDATSLTEAGYIGDDIESVVSKLLAAADNDVDRAEHGIIFIDEIDKIAKKQSTNHRDVSGEAVQQGLLRLLEGSEVEVPVGATSKNAMVPLETVNTRNILFICGGAFPDLENVIRERLSRKSSMGFQADLKDKYDRDRNILQKVSVDDLRAFGMIPEFLGRLPVIFSLESLTEDMLVEILKEPKNAIIRQYTRLMELDEVKLTFTDEALHVIAAKAMEKDTGARGLRAVIEEFMLDIMYEIPKDDAIGEVVITKEYVEHTGVPLIIPRSRVRALPGS